MQKQKTHIFANHLNVKMTCKNMWNQ